MPQPRKSQISIDATPYYHCVSRCVRRAFLCGKDKFAGRSFEHRRAFIESEILRLGQVFFLEGKYNDTQRKKLFVTNFTLYATVQMQY